MTRTIPDNWSGTRAQATRQLGLLCCEAVETPDLVADVAVLIRAGADIDKFGDSSPLHSVAFIGHEKLCDLLLKAGASVDIEDSNKQKALHIAAELQHEYICRALLRAGSWVPRRYIIHYDGMTGREKMLPDQPFEYIEALRERMTQEVHAQFSSLPLTRGHFFVRGEDGGEELHPLVAEACVVAPYEDYVNFRNLIAEPLIAAGDHASLALFEDIYNALPGRWQPEFTSEIVRCRRALTALGGEGLTAHAKPEGSHRDRVARRPRGRSDGGQAP